MENQSGLSGLGGLDVESARELFLIGQSHLGDEIIFLSQFNYIEHVKFCIPRMWCRNHKSGQTFTKGPLLVK